jgi:hypothetical protein
MELGPSDLLVFGRRSLDKLRFLVLLLEFSRTCLVGQQEKCPLW